MPGMGLDDTLWTMDLHDRPLLKAHKPLPRRRPYALPAANSSPGVHNATGDVLAGRQLQTGQHEAFSPARSQNDGHTRQPSPSTAAAPSEHSRDDSSTAETIIHRSRATTPIHQQAPPTPDFTPPQIPGLLNPAFPPNLDDGPVSSRAESFTTAREETLSEDESNDRPHSRSSARNTRLHSPIPRGRISRPSPLSQPGSQDLTPKRNTILTAPCTEGFLSFDGSWSNGEDKFRARSSKVQVKHDDESAAIDPTQSPPSPAARLLPSPLPTPPADLEDDERIIESELPSSTVGAISQPDLVEAEADFSENGLAQHDGWSFIRPSPESRNRINSWRLSGVSTTSTVEAIVVEADTSPGGQRRLRHSQKNPSLRSTSSPFPSDKEDAIVDRKETFHRLVHKKGQITNKCRWSVSTDVTHSASPAQFLAEQASRDVIHVAIVPKWQMSSSTNGSRRHSAPLNTSSPRRRLIARSDHPTIAAQLPLRKKRAMSNSLPSEVSTMGYNTVDSTRRVGRSEGHPVSAPTSRSNSRADSMTSEHFRLRRLAAEEDLHRTLERMESERSVNTVQQSSPVSRWLGPQSHNSDHNGSDTGEMSFLSPPFSPPSMDSAFSGTVEMGQARAVSLFAHNNHSLQIVEQSAQSDDRPFSWLRSASVLEGLPPSVVKAPATPVGQIPQQSRVASSVSSLRHPREPPNPPRLEVIPPTPAYTTPVGNKNSGEGRVFRVPLARTISKNGSISRRFGSTKKLCSMDRAPRDSFVRFISRGVNLRNPRNRKASLNLDSHLHPFWRPRAFWENFSDSGSDSDSDFSAYDSEHGYDSAQRRDEFVSNTLGMPQKKGVVNGPLSLVRRLSGRSRGRPAQFLHVLHNFSHTSLPRSLEGHTRARTGTTITKSNAYRVGHKAETRNRFRALRELHNRWSISPWGNGGGGGITGKDDKRERDRQALREKINPYPVLTNASRYPDHPGAATSSAGPVMVN